MEKFIPARCRTKILFYEVGKDSVTVRKTEIDDPFVISKSFTSAPVWRDDPGAPVRELPTMYKAACFPCLPLRGRRLESARSASCVQSSVLQAAKALFRCCILKKE